MAPWVTKEHTKKSQIVSADRECGWLRMRTSVPQSLLSGFIFLLKSHWTSGWSEGDSGCSSMCSTCTSLYLSHPDLSDLELICPFKTLRLCPSLYIKQHPAMLLGTWMQCLYSLRAVCGLLYWFSNNSWAQFRSWHDIDSIAGRQFVCGLLSWYMRMLNYEGGPFPASWPHCQRIALAHLVY